MKRWLKIGLIGSGVVLIVILGAVAWFLSQALPVGAGFTAKQGTTVKNIHLVPGNSEQIEGRVNGTKIVLLSCYLKKL